MESVVREATRHYGRVGFLLLQEAGSWTRGMRAAKWTAHTRLGQLGAVLIPDELEHRVRHEIHKERIAAVLVGHVAVCSWYLPQVHWGRVAYEGAIHDMDHTLEDMRRKGAKTMVVGVDAQDELPANVELFTGPLAEGKVTGRMSDRATLLYEWAIKWGLVAGSTLKQEPRWADRWWTTTNKAWGGHRRLDYIFVTDTAKGVTAGNPHTWKWPDRDHQPVGIKVRGKQKIDGENPQPAAKDGNQPRNRTDATTNEERPPHSGMHGTNQHMEQAWSKISSRRRQKRLPT